MRTLLKNVNCYTLTERHVITIMFNLLCATETMHKAGLMHRDIKPANILVDGQSRVLLCDFGSTRPMIPDNNFKQVSNYMECNANHTIQPNQTLSGNGIASSRARSIVSPKSRIRKSLMPGKLEYTSPKRKITMQDLRKLENKPSL